MSSTSISQSGQQAEMIPLSVIRTETVLSRLPIHNLCKRGRINIEIRKHGERGSVDLLWEVSYNDRYGPPRQLAYKLDTLVVNRRIEEADRPLPKHIRLGSLREICKELDLSEGEATNQVKRAIHQNAGAYITAKLTYKANDGTERRLEAGFTRYNVVFTGEQMPDGRRADAVYLILNDPYREVLNSAPVRPLDYGYLKALTPASQRFYEVVSYRIFAALKFKHPHARINYSDYCNFSAQQRYFDYEHFKKQMYKVHRPHLLSGYLSTVRFEETADDEGRIDWIMFYTPGPKARAEYATFTRKGKLTELTVEAIAPPREGQPAPAPNEGTPEAEGEALVRELVRRGVTKSRAEKLLASLPADQHVLDQLEWGDSLVAKAPAGTYRNPPGFFVHLVQNNVPVPESFETSRKRRIKLEAERDRSEEARERAALELEYEEYRREALDRYLEERLTASKRRERYEAKRKELLKQLPFAKSWPDEEVREVVQAALRLEVEGEAGLMGFKEFCEKRKTKRSKVK
jgi:hypothetical protein